MRNFSITLISLFLTTIVIGNAFYQKKQFYPSVVYITKSNPSMAVIYIQAFILVILSGKLMRKVFFGDLRPVELEHLMERSWYAVTETCLAFTVFRDDFSPKFVALFTLLLFLKSFHWLADERVDFMERSPVISFLFHIRIVSLLVMLATLDVCFVAHAYQSTLTKGASVQLVFGFEYAILLTIILNIVIKYAFHVNDFHEMPWENKAVFLLYTELVMGLIKVLLYISFVFIMVRIYTLPLFAFRPMYYTVRSFKNAVNDVIMSRRAIRNMNTLYPDATPEELAAADNVCIICREEMHSASKKLPCNHIFHTSCLRSWFQRQQTCPTCRLNILRTPGSSNSPTPQARRNREQNNEQQHQQPQPQQQQNPPQPNHQHVNFQWVNGHQPGNAENMAGPSTSRGNQSQNIPQNANDVPFFYPPPFPFMAFNVPPPMPPPQGLSDEELKLLEIQTREGIEARLKCLQNIQSLLDASLFMMNQYNAAVAASHLYGNLNGTGSTPKESTDEATTSKEEPKEPKSETSAESQSQDSQEEASSSGTGPEVKSSEVQAADDEAVRLKRVEKFTKLSGPSVNAS